MSEELKALLNVIFDAAGAVEAAIQKQPFITVVLPKLESLVIEFPGLISNAGNLKPELEALLANTAGADADFITFVASKFASDSAKTQAIIKAAGQVAIDSLALFEAIKA